MKSYPSLETERLWLKPTSIEDAEFIFTLLNTPKWLKYIGDRNVHSIEDAEDYIKVKMLPQLERLGYGNYTLVRKSDQQKLGTCGIYDREGLEGVDIGFALLSDYEGAGYAFEAASKVIQVARDQYGISLMKGITTTDNHASQKLLKKLGLQLKGPIRLPDDPAELLLFEL